jgi:hypothetical protein
MKVFQPNALNSIGVLFNGTTFETQLRRSDFCGPYAFQLFTM